MGNSIAPPPMNFRVDRVKKTFGMPDPQLEKLWRLFLTHDRDKKGTVSVQDFFERILKYPRSPLTDNLFSLIETAHESCLDFGEFVELVTTFCCFEERELLKYFFYVLDPHRVGIIEVSDLKHLIVTIQPERGLIREALQYLDDLNATDAHTANFEVLVSFKKKYPFAFNPLFQLQARMIQATLGEFWWEGHKAGRHDLKAEQRRQELAKLEKDRRDTENEKAAATEEVLRKRMGMRYYLMPWQRAAEHRKLTKIFAIEAELEKQAAAAAAERTRV